MKAVTVVLIGLCFTALTCGGEGGQPDGGETSLPLDERLEPGEVRAGIVTRQTELLQGPEAHGWLGDFKLYNSRVAFIIQSIDAPRGWGPYGGSLLDADRIREEGQAGHELFQEALPVINLQGVRPTFAEVAADGSDGKPAVVRITGEHQGIPLVDAATGGAMQPLDLDIIHEYILEPDLDYLRIRTTLRVRGLTGKNVSVGDLVLNGDLTTDFAPGTGVLPDFLPTGEYEYYTGFSQDVCYLYAGVQQDVRALITIEAITPFVVADGTAPPLRSEEDSFVVERVLAVGKGGQDSCLRILNQLRGDSDIGLLSGTVTDTSGQPLPGAMILAKQAASPWVFVDQTHTDESGFFEMQLSPDEYLVAVRAAGRDEYLSEVVQVTSEQTNPLDVQVPEAARLAYHCQGQDREGNQTGPLPCKISLQAGPQAGMQDPVHLEALTFSITGDGEMVIPPGDWTVTLSRGWEYSIHRQDVASEPGKTVQVSGVLERQVDTRDLIAADLHTHCTRSVDSGFNIEDKIASNICEGVEVVVITDHDCQTDFTPFIQELKQKLSFDLDSLIRAVTGSEISPLYGHMTAFPLPTHPTGWIYWQIPWTYYQDGAFVRMLEFPELWERARELGAEVINLAHPLSDSGYFNYLGFDPPGQLPDLDTLAPEKYTDGFDTMELLNGKGTNSMLNKNLLLWSHLNNQGVFKTAVGVSDSHSRLSEAGFGRTMVVSSSDQPGDVDLDQIWTSLRQGRAMVSGGILIRIRIEEAGSGDLLTVNPPFDVHLHVEAADWVSAEQAILLANGEQIAVLPLEAPGVLDPAHPAVRFHGQVAVSPATDTWYAATASAAEGAVMDPVCRGCRPAGMTNAIRVDIDGNGHFDPPAP